MPDLFWGISVTATGIDAENHGFYILVFCQFFQISDDIRTDYLLLVSINTWSSHSHDASLTVIDSDFVAHHIVVIDSRIDIFHGNLSNLLVWFQTELFLYDIPDLIIIAETIYEFTWFQEFAVVEHHEPVCIVIERILADFSTVGNIRQHLLPESVDIAWNLLTVSITHLILGVGFRKTFIFTHFYHREMDAKLGSHILDILWLRWDSVPIYITFWVYINLIGNGG